MTTFEPRPFGKYYLTDLVAVGGMAEIYKAKTFGVDGFEKILAIKKILSNYSSDREFVEMLADEARLVVNLSHTNIVQVYDLGRVGNDYYIAMEYIDGVNLRELVARLKEAGEAMPPAVAYYLIAETCKGLDYAHSKRGNDGKPLKIVHRDVSPQNILVSFDSEVKIVDFGIAKAVMTVSQTHVGTLKGKVTYMSPEQAFGKPVDGRADIFSAGLVLYELFTGTRLFNGESQMEVLKKIRNSRITVESLPDSIPQAVKPVLAKALSYLPRDRYATAADFQVALTRLIYSTAPDFSPKVLSDLLRKVFPSGAHHESQIQAQRPEVESLVSAVSSVSIGSSVDAPDPNATLFIGQSPPEPEPSLSRQETLRPDQAYPGDFVNNSDLPEPQDDHLTTTGKIDILGESRKRKIWGQAILFVFIFVSFLALGGFGWRFWQKWQTHQSQIAVSITTIPGGAKIIIDDHDTEMVTPATLTNLISQHHYRLRLMSDGYKVIDRDFVPTKDSQQSLTIDLVQEQPTFSLTVRTTPVGANVVLDGKPLEPKTPTTFSGLDLSQIHRLELKLDGYRDYVRNVTSKTGRDQILDITLAVIPSAQLSVNSTPDGAQIFLNDSNSGFLTPHVFDKLPSPASLTVTLKKADYQDQSAAIDLKTGDQETLNLSLTKLGKTR